jgi:hypothetical protein
MFLGLRIKQAMWFVINKETWKSLKYDKKMEVCSNTKILPNPQNVASTLNTSL